MKYAVSVLLAVFVSPAIAQETRHLGSHEHGVGKLDIAFDGNTVVMDFHAPGADLVGFEYAAKSAEDRAAIDAAVAMLARPLDLFVLPAAAECSVVQASAELESEDHHEHEEHADHDHEDAHDDHEDEAGHTEFHAEYALTCANPDALTEITFAYFDRFENAREVEVQIVSASGAKAFEVERDAPVLDLRGMF